jgi:hypothetical protein
MALPLSPNTAKAVEKLFPDESKDEVVRLLTEKCADNLPFCEHEDEYDLEDHRFRVLKLSDGNIEKLHKAVQIANEDLRDLIISVGSVRKYKRKLLGDALERNAESNQIFYSRLWSTFIALAAFTSLFILRLVGASNLKIVVVIVSIVVIYFAGLLLVNRLLSPKSFYKGLSMMSRLGAFLFQVISFVGVPATLGFFIAYAIQYFF